MLWNSYVKNSRIETLCHSFELSVICFLQLPFRTSFTSSTLFSITMFSKCTSIAAIAIIFANATTAIPAKSSSESTDVDAAASTTQAGAASACTISDFSQVSGCLRSTQITVSNLQVPGGETLSLEKLQDGTTVTFSGTTTFGYKEWVSESFLHLASRC